MHLTLSYLSCLRSLELVSKPTATVGRVKVLSTGLLYLSGDVSTTELESREPVNDVT